MHNQTTDNSMLVGSTVQYIVFGCYMDLTVAHRGFNMSTFVLEMVFFKFPLVL